MAIFNSYVKLPEGKPHFLSEPPTCDCYPIICKLWCIISAGHCKYHQLGKSENCESGVVLNQVMNICGISYVLQWIYTYIYIYTWYNEHMWYQIYSYDFTGNCNHQVILPHMFIVPNRCSTIYPLSNIISGTYRKQLPYHNLDHLPYIYQTVHKVIVTYSLRTPLTIDISHTVSITTYYTSLAIINPSEFQWTSQYPKKHTLPTLPVGFPWTYRIQSMCGITFFLMTSLHCGTPIGENLVLTPI